MVKALNLVMNSRIGLQELQKHYLRMNETLYLVNYFKLIYTELNSSPENFTIYGNPAEHVFPIFQSIKLLQEELIENTFKFRQNDNIDRILSIYFLCHVVSKSNDQNLEFLLKFLVLLRAYLNMIGKDKIKVMEKMEIEKANRSYMNRDYTSFYHSFDIPFEIPDFYDVYLNNNFAQCKRKEFKFYILDLTNFLFDEDISFYKTEC